MRRLRIASLVLLAAGLLVVVVSAVRIGLYWVIDPWNDVLVPVAGLLLASGSVAGALTLQPLQGRPLRIAVALAAAGAVLGGAVRLIVDLPAHPGGVLVPYGPGTPPSISWTLLCWQVAGPVLSVTATALLAAALAASIAGVARAVGRLHTA